MRAGTLSLLVVLSIGSPLHAQDVAYDKYTLPNDMTVILHEDHSLPVACINIWYHVAAKDEAAGRSGFAHLFEHLMFMGTQRVPGAEFDNIMEAGGGWNNASTSEDRTNYFSMGPAELLPTLLWLDADRLEALGENMTQDKLDKQRAVVRNERRQSIENVPYGKAELAVFKLMYPEDHPYWGTVIGSHEDLEAATVDDVKNFFAKYYVPNNASLVVAGDFDPKQIKPLIAKLFGTLPRGSDVEPVSAEPVQLGAVKRMTFTDAVQFPRVYMVYHSPKHFAPGDAEMDLTAGVLSSGISSRLYQKLIYTNKLATAVNAYQASMLLGSLFFVEVTALPDADLGAVERAVDEVLAEFAAKGPTAEELERQKAQIEFSMVSNLQSILAKADRLNMYDFHLGEPNSFKWDLDRYRNATKSGVRDWAKKVLTPDSRLVMRVIPEIETPDTDPRSQKPTIETARHFDPLLPTSFALSNGITVHHWERTELPLIVTSLLLNHGSAYEPAAKAGLADLTADMLDEGAGSRSAIEFADALDALGANFRTSIDYEDTTATLTALARNYDESLALMADALLRPRFDEPEWERVHDLHLERLQQALDVPALVAQQVSMRAYFGDGHPYSQPIAGSVATASTITLDDIKGWHHVAYRPSEATLFVAGDIKTEALRGKLEAAFGSWTDQPSMPAPPQKPRYASPSNDALRVVVVDRPDAVQTVVRFIMPGPAYDSPERQELELFSTILGGSFTSRLNQNLREDKGYTYGARCSYDMDPSVGYFTAGAAVRADVTGPSVAEFLNEFSGIRGGNISEGEAAKARATQRMRMMQSFGGLNGMVASAITLVRNGKPFTQLADDLQEMAGITESQLNGLAYNAVSLEKGLLVLVGDKDVIHDQIASLELPEPEELTVTGDVVTGR